MAVKLTGDIRMLGDGLQTDDANNLSIAYEVYKYIPTSDLSFWLDLRPDAKDSNGVSTGFDSLNDFRGWARHNSFIQVTLTDFIQTCEVHVPDHTDLPDFPIGETQLGSDVSAPYPDVVGELWGDGTPAGGDNDIYFYNNNKGAYTSSLGIEYRYRTRTRFSSTWGSWTSWIGPYQSTAVNLNMRDDDAHFELRQTWGGLYTSNTSSYALQIDVDGTDYSVPTSDNITTKFTTRTDNSANTKFQTNGGADITSGTTPSETEIGVRIFRATKGTADPGGPDTSMWTSVWPSSGQSYGSAAYSFGYTSSTDIYTCNFGLYDYLFEVEDLF